MPNPNRTIILVQTIISGALAFALLAAIVVLQVTGHDGSPVLEGALFSAMAFYFGAHVGASASNIGSRVSDAANSSVTVPVNPAPVTMTVSAQQPPGTTTTVTTPAADAGPNT